MTQDDLDQRQRDDFRFMVLCHSKGDPAMYDLLRDRTLDQPKDQPMLNPPTRPGAMYEHPGAILTEELNHRRIPAAEAADRIGAKPTELRKVMLGDAPMNAALAVRLERNGFASADYWMVLQMQHDLYLERQKK